MRRTAVALILSAGLFVGTAQASAAPTRAEYIGSVDPVCQSFVGPMGAAWTAFHRGFKRANHAAKTGNGKAFVRGARQTIRALNTNSSLRNSMSDQIAAIQPPDADSSLIATWLGDLRQESQFEASAATALGHARFRAFFQNLSGADNAEGAGKSVISGFGFQVCGVFPVV